MRHYTFLLLSALSGLLFCSPVTATHLMDVYQLAVNSDPQIKAADAKRYASLELQPQSQSTLLPNISASLGVAYTSQSISSSAFSTDDDFSAANWSISLAQPIYRKNLLIGVEQAKIAVKQANIAYAAEEQNLIARVATRYFAVLNAEDDVTFARSEKKAISRQLDQTKQRFDVGLIAVTDVNEAQARYDQAVANEISAENQLANSKENLREVTGQYHNQLNRLGKDIPLTPPQPANIDEWAKSALSQNLNLTATIYSAQIAREEIERQQAGHYPTLDAVVSYSGSDSSSDRLGSNVDTASLGVQLNIPIFQGGFVSSKTREAQYLYEQAKFQVEDSRRAVERQARNAYLNIQSSIGSVNALKQAVVSTKSALDATEAGFEVGTRTIVDVLNAQQEYLRAKRSYSNARHTYILSTLNLKLAAGTLSPADLQQITTWLTVTGPED